MIPRSLYDLIKFLAYGLMPRNRHAGRSRRRIADRNAILLGEADHVFPRALRQIRGSPLDCVHRVTEDHPPAHVHLRRLGDYRRWIGDQAQALNMRTTPCKRETGGQHGSIAIRAVQTRKNTAEHWIFFPCGGGSQSLSDCWTGPGPELRLRRDIEVHAAGASEKSAHCLGAIRHFATTPLRNQRRRSRKLSHLIQ